MAFDITTTARNLKDQTGKTPQLILEIDGIPIRFGTDTVLRFPTFDENPVLQFDTGLKFDSPVEDENSRAYIMLEGTTRNVTNQIIQEKGGAGGIQSFAIQLLNKDNELTQYFTTGNYVSDLLGRDARIYLGFKGGVYPRDFVLLFDGRVDNFESRHGSYRINVAHADQFRRATILNIRSTNLTTAIDDSQTNIPVSSTDEFIIPTAEQEENFKSYLFIDEELMKIESATASEFTVLRNQLGTSAAEHDINTEVTSYHRLEGKSIDLSLKLMLSDGSQAPYISEFEVNRFVQSSGTDTIPNAIFFDVDVEQQFNVIEGDLVSTTGATNAENNISNRIITEIVQTTDGSYIVVDGDALVFESPTSATIDFVSQYNTLPEGLGFANRFVDFESFTDIEEKVGGTLPDIDLYIPEEITVKETVESQLYKPLGLFSLPRKGRVGIGASLPPLNTGVTTFINPDTINTTAIKGMAIRRSVSRNFYNTIVYKFEEDSIESGKFKAGTIVQSEDSINRISAGNRQLTMEASGLRDNPSTRTSVLLNATRILDKYQFGPQFLDGVQLLYGDGYTIEVGDTVVLEGIQIPDTESGDAIFPTTLMEVTNKSLDINGRVKVNLLNSAFNIGGRFGVISASSEVTGKPSANKLSLKTSIFTGVTEKETDQWEEHIGRPVKVRDRDFTREQVLTIRRIDSGLESTLEFEEDITILIDGTEVLTLADYDETDDYQRASYCYFDPVGEISGVTSNQVVDVSDPSIFFIGAICEVHSPDFSNISQEVTVDDITGTTITFSEALNYTPSISDKIDLIGFASDEGLPYRIF